MKFLTISLALTASACNAFHTPLLTIAKTATRAPSTPLFAVPQQEEPYRPEVVSASDLICLTNTVKHVVDSPYKYVVDAFQNTLLEQRDLMQDRVAAITDLLSKAQMTITATEEHCSQDALSHAGYTSLAIQMKQQTNDAAASALQIEYAIAVSRIKLLDSSLEQFLVSKDHASTILPDQANVQPLLDSIQSQLDEERQAAAVEATDSEYSK